MEQIWRKAWCVIRRGEILPHFYLMDELFPESFYHPEEVTIVGPFRVLAPPPPTDMVAMTRVQWSSKLGYYEEVA